MPQTKTFKPGDAVICLKGDIAEIGIVKSVPDDGHCFVNYHTGDTAARTSNDILFKIANAYAFHIVRLDPDGNEREIKLDEYNPEFDTVE